MPCHSLGICRRIDGSVNISREELPIPAETNEPDTQLAAPGRRNRRRLIAIGSVGGLVVVLAVVFALAGWLGGTSRPTRNQAAPETATSPGGSARPTPGSSAPGSAGAGSGPARGPGSAAPPASPSKRPAPPVPAKGATLVAGPSCPRSAIHAAVALGNWSQVDGGWTGNGCHGKAEAHLTSASGAESVTWKFATRGAGTCAVEVYVTPQGTTPVAYYDVVSGSQVNSFTVNQVDHPGRWVRAGSFPSSSGGFSVRLTDRGDGRAVVVADAIRLTCH